MNIWTLTGNLGRDAEIRYLPNGDPVASFSVGVRAGYGEKATTTWANCSLFGRRAESLAPYLTKGQQVAVSGEVNLRVYTTKEGTERQSLDVRVASLDLIGGKSERQEPPAKTDHPAKPSGGSGFDDFEDDIPF